MDYFISFEIENQTGEFLLFWAECLRLHVLTYFRRLFTFNQEKLVG